MVSRTDFEIRDENGALKAIHNRFDFDDGSKSMAWLLPGGTPSNNGAIKPARLPLFGSELLQDRPGELVIVVEGESAARALQQLGLLGLGTVTGASGSPDREVLAVLAGRIVYVWPDADPPGLQHMQCVGRLATKAGATSVRILRWPEAGPTEDAVDFVQRLRRVGRDDSAIRREVEQLIRFAVSFDAMDGQAPPSVEDTAASEAVQPVVAPWVPYPMDALPESLRALAVEGAAAIGCDPAMIAMPSLVACAGAIGLARSVKVKDGWCEPSILWGASVVRSGARKDPALDLAAAPLRDLDDAARRAHRRAMKEYCTDKSRYERDLTQWKQAKDALHPTEPEPPRRGRLVIQDATYEAVSRLIAEVPRASLVAVRGELSAWVREWGEYRATGCTDRAHG